MVKREGYPWSPLRQLVGNSIHLSPDSETWQEAATKTDHQLRNLWRPLDDRAKELTHQLAAIHQPAEPRPLPDPPTIQIAVI